MLVVRIGLLQSSAVYLGKSVAIAARYSNIRTQFKDESGKEITIIDYQLQRQKILTQLAKAYAMQITYQKLRKFVENVFKQAEKHNFSNLKEAHILLAGGKAMYTDWTQFGILKMVQACGGHGYSAYSGITTQFGLQSPNSILEGDNNVLFLQVAKFMLKIQSYLEERRYQKIKGYFYYFRQEDVFEKFSTVSDNQEFLDCEKLLVLYQKCCFLLMKKILKSFKNLGHKFSKNYIINFIEGANLILAGKLHTLVFTLHIFNDKVENTQDPSLKQALYNLCQLISLQQLLKFSNIFVMLEIINGKFIRIARERCQRLFDLLAKDLLVLAELFVPHEHVLYSLIADTNEKPYENMYRMARDHGLMNQVDLRQEYLGIIRRTADEVWREPRL